MSFVRPSVFRSRRLSLASRIIAAIVGGYAVTALAMLALSLALPFIGAGRAEAVFATTMVSFLMYAAIIMAVFHAHSALQAWFGILAAAVVCGALIGASKAFGGF